MAQYAVIGLGRFGATLAQQLVHLGHEVIGIDYERKVVEDLSALLSYAVVADATDERALSELNLERCDAVIVAIGENLLASLLCVVHLKTLDVREVWAKATHRAHHLILSRLGVNRIVHPEEDIGARTAQALCYPMFREYMPLGSNQYLVEVPITEHLAGRRLGDWLTGLTHPVQALLVKRRDTLLSAPAEDFHVELGDTVILAGDRQGLTQLAPLLGKR